MKLHIEDIYRLRREVLAEPEAGDAHADGEPVPPEQQVSNTSRVEEAP